MKTKHFFQVLIIFLLTFQLNGQINWGVQLGLNGTNISQSISDDYHDLDYPTKLKLGFNVGVVADYPLNDEMGFQSGLLYTQKGYQVDWDALLKREGMDGSITGYWTYSYNYLELPVHFYYSFDDFYIIGGPYFAYGLGGTSKLDATYKYNGNSSNIKQTINLQAVSGAAKAEDFFDLDADVPDIKVYNAFDIGFDIGAGYKLEQFMLTAKYSFGFTNLTPKVSDNDNFDPNDLKKTNNGFSLSLVYFFTD